jgi:ATP-dependent Clp endopeptidase proteolytic subunit ClpP
MINWLKVMVKATIGEIYIYGEIDDFKYWGDEVTPTDIKDELNKLKNVSSINLFVNSPGGGVFAGAAIYNELKRFDKPITAYVDGLAASIASLIVLAADKVVMPSNAMYMIHNPWMLAVGDAPKLRDMADKLDKITDSVLLETYANKTGMKKEDLQKMLDDETWLSGAEAVELGFADELEEEQKIAACYVGDNVKFNNVEVQLSKFRAFPKSKFTEHKPKMSLKQRHKHKITMLSAQL